MEVEETDSLAKTPEETDPQDLREEAQGLTAIINAREEKPGPEVEGEILEHAMSGSNLGESNEPKVEVEDTNSPAKMPEETDPQACGRRPKA